jgi:hypothetical protein
MQRVLPQLNDRAASLWRLRVRLSHAGTCAANETVAIKNFNARKIVIFELMERSIER